MINIEELLISTKNSLKDHNSDDLKKSVFFECYMNKFINVEKTHDKNTEELVNIINSNNCEKSVKDSSKVIDKIDRELSEFFNRLKS